MTTQTFHPFPRLPVELQAQIWDYVLPPPSVLTPLSPSTSPPENNPGKILARLSQIHHSSLPAIAAVTIHYTSTTQAPIKLYLRPNIDILFLGNISPETDSESALDIAAFLTDEENQRVVKRLAIQWGRNLGDQSRLCDCGQSLKLVHGLRNLHRLWLVHGFSSGVSDWPSLEGAFLHRAEDHGWLGEGEVRGVVGERRWRRPVLEFVQSWLVGRLEIGEWRGWSERLRAWRKGVLG